MLNIKLEFVLIVLVLLTSCSFDGVEELTSFEKTSKAAPIIDETTQVQGKLGDVFENVNNLIGTSDLKSNYFDNEPRVSREGNVFTLDYNEVPNYSGMLVIEFSSEPSYLSLNLKATVKCQNFVDDGLQINGEIEFVVDDYVPNGISIFTFKSIGELQLSYDLEDFTWMFSYVISQDKTISSDVFYLLNGISVQEKNGYLNEVEISEDLYKGDACKYPKFGLVNYTLNKDSDDEYKVAVDYGVDSVGEHSNLCDAYIQISSGSFSSLVTLD